MSKLPNGWREAALGEIIKIKYGKDHQHLAEGKYPLYGSGGIMRYVENFLYTSESILIPRKGTLTNLFYVNKPFWSVDTIFYTEIDSDEVIPKFLFYKLSTINLAGLNVGSAVPSLTTKVLNPLELEIPPLPEQKAIADVLSSLDEKIELLQEENKTLEELAQTMFKEWFVNFNYHGATGEMEDSELGEIPKGWRVGKLEEEFKVTMGQSPKGETYNEIGEGMVFYQGRAEFQSRFPKRRLYTTDPKRTAEKFDVLMSVRAPVGDINVASEKCCIGRGLSAIYSKYKSYALYKMKALKSQFDTFESEGTVFGSINKNSLENIEVVIPILEIVNSFEEVTTIMDEKIYNNSEQIQTLSHTRDTLLPKLMSGEIRVEGFGE